MPGSWVKAPSSRLEVLEMAFHKALHDAMAMKEITEEACAALMNANYDMNLDDLEEVIEHFTRAYLDPNGLRADESVEDLDGDSGVIGAYFIGVMTGWRYHQYNDHAFKEEEEE